MSQTALIVIDMQCGMFAGDLHGQMHEGDVLLENTSRLISAARTSDLPIIYIQHCAYPGQALVKGTRAWEIHPNITPMKSDTIVEKHESSAFKNTVLADVLQEQDITTLVTCGLQSEHCVANTSLSALELGFNVIVVNDCHSTFPSQQLTAKEIVAQQNSRLEEKGADVASAFELTNGGAWRL